MDCLLTSIRWCRGPGGEIAIDGGANNRIDLVRFRRKPEPEPTGDPQA